MIFKVVDSKYRANEFGDGSFPVYFTAAYGDFIKASGNKLVLVYSPQMGLCMPIKDWRSGFLKIATILYAPLRNDGTSPSVEDELVFMQAFLKTVKEGSIFDRISAPNNTALFRSAPKNTVFTGFGTYKVDLYPRTYEKVFLSFQARYRTAIRQAQNVGIRIEYGEKVLTDFYELHKITMERSGMFVASSEYFKNYFNCMRDNVLISVAYSESVPVGALLLTYSKHSAQYLYGCSSDNIQASGAIKYLHADAMRLLILKDVKEYDFVGARISANLSKKLRGIQEFKSRFGTHLVKGFIWKCDVSKAKCFIYNTMLMVKVTLKGHQIPIDIIDQELGIQGWGIPRIKGRIALRYKRERDRISKKFRKYDAVVTADSLKRDLDLSGIKKGDTIIVHSSLSKVGNVFDGAKTVVNCLLDHLGSEGNLVFPAFSYTNSMLETAINAEYIFDPITTPSVVGSMSEYFRRLPGVKRSVHPTHSFCAFGPKANEIVEGHFEAPTNFGELTPLHRLRELNGKIVGIGIGVGPVTIYHTVEDFYPTQFKQVYLDRAYPMKVRVNGELRTKQINIHDPDAHKVRIDKKQEIENWFDAHLRSKGILKSSSFGKTDIWWMNIQELFDELLVLKKENITIYNIPLD